MKKISILCLLLLSALMMLVGCKADPEAFNNIPTLRLGEPTDLLRTSVTLHGSLQTDHPGHIREYGFLFSSSIDFTSSDTQTIPVTEDSMADITASVSGLTIGETYFYALYATTGGEKMLSEVASVTMPTRSGATISKPEIVDLYTPTLKARITDDGGSIITSVGFCWSTSPNPTIFTGEHEFATYDEESQSFTADLTKLKGHEDYYIRAFAECDVTGGGDVSISYGEVGTLALKHKVTLEAINATTTTLTFALTPFNCDEVKWLVVPQSEAEGITAERVFSEGTSANATQRSEVTAENLKPETTYAVYAAAENKGVKVLSEKLEITTTAVDSETMMIYYTSTDEQIVEPYDATVFGANIVSNTYENGQGIILFDGPVTSIGNRAFYECSKLKNITIPNGTRTIGEFAFCHCRGLITIAIPDSVTSIDGFAFSSCSGLTTISIPDNVTSIGDGPFAHCSSLKAFYGKYASDNNRCLIIAGTLNSFAPAGLTSYIIPNNITSIGHSVFSQCSNLTSIIIPEGVTSIRDSAFGACSNLTSITIPDSVKIIEWYAFTGCSGLISITIPEGVTTIGLDAFRSCKNLASVYCKPATPPSGAKAFDDNASGRKIYVPNASVDAYKAAYTWRNYADATVGYDF
ncbi:MAG: leucine-rich repeat domain-containing protein [Rikenellaceae bacterium]|nr:leucine-rich repeat domain-containing protein [Rikenellaceae bacterium]